MNDTTVTIGVVVNLLAFLLPHLGISIDNQSLQTTIQSLVIIVSSAAIWWKHRSVQNELKGLKGIA